MINNHNFPAILSETKSITHTTAIKSLVKCLIMAMLEEKKIEVYISWEPKLSLIFKLYDDNGMTCQKISVVTWEQWVDTTYDDRFIMIFKINKFLTDFLSWFN